MVTILSSLVCVLADLLNQLATADSNTAAAEDGTETAERSSAPSSPASSRRGSRSSDCQEIQPKYSQEQLDAVRKWVSLVSSAQQVVLTLLLLCDCKVIVILLWYDLYIITQALCLWALFGHRLNRLYFLLIFRTLMCSNNDQNSGSERYLQNL